MEERIVQTLKQLGFTASAAKAYMALLKEYPATGYELAARSGVPRSAIYNVMRRLEAQGVVNAVSDKPARYVPLAPQQLCSLIRSRVGRDLSSLEGALQDLARPSAAETWTIRGYAETLDRAAELIERSRKSVWGAVWRREATRLAEPIHRAVERGLDVVLFSFTALEDGLGHGDAGSALAATVLSYGIAEAELEKYWTHRLILISDNTRLLAGGAELGDENRAVVSEEAALLDMARSNLVLDVTLLGERTGRKVADVVTQFTAPMAPVEELVASAALVNG